MSSSPRLWGDLLYIVCITKGPAYVLALNKETGEQVWNTPRRFDVRDDVQEAYSSPSIFQRPDGCELIVSGAAHLDSYDLQSGSRLWSVAGPAPNGPVGRIIASPAVGTKMIVGTGPNPTGAGKGRIIGIRNGQEQWSYNRGATPDSSSPVIVDDMLYMISEKGLAACLDAGSGESIWEKRLGAGSYHASLVAGDGKVYCLGLDGVCTVIQQGRSGQILSRNVLAGTFYATPAISNGTIYFRAYEALYAVSGK